MSPVCPIWPRIGNPDSHDALVSGTKDPSYSEKTVKHGRERLGMKRWSQSINNACRGPAPADPGYLKERRLGEGQGITA